VGLQPPSERVWGKERSGETAEKETGPHRPASLPRRVTAL
jgi:hypothetical protein